MRHRRNEPHAHKRRKRSKEDQVGRRDLVVGLALVGVGAVLIISICLVVGLRLYSARGYLETARSDLLAVADHRSELNSSAGRAHALEQLSSAERHAAQAEEAISSSPSVSLLAKLPFVGTQIRGVSNLASDVHTASGQAAILLNEVNQLEQASTGTTISLPRLSTLQVSVTHAVDALLVTERSPGGLIGPIGSARDAYNTKMSTIITQLENGNQILPYLSTFLGAGGPRTYLLATENQAEMRDQGSILSVAQIHAVDGHLSSDTPTSVSSLALSQPVNYPIPAGTAAVFGLDRPTQLWQSANLTADFPWAGGDLVAMYQQATGFTDDGVVAMDVHALAGLLSLTGPVYVDGISVPVSASNVETLLLDTLYEQYPAGSQAARKDLSSAVAVAAVDRLSQEHVDPVVLAHLLAGEVAGRHLILYDATASNEATISRYGASGAVDTTNPARTFHLAVVNAAANKIDYFLTTSIHQHVFVGADGGASVVTTVTVTNHAPAGRAPSYQLGPNSGTSEYPGQYVGIAYLWSPSASTVTGGTPESGLVVSAENIDVMPGRSETLSFGTNIPHAVKDGALSLRWIPQPTVHPQELQATATGISGVNLSADPQRPSLLTKPIELSWSVSGAPGAG